MARATWKGRVIAESDDVVEIEGNLYFPLDALDRSLVVDSDTHTVCGWKGTASYFTLEVDGQQNPDAAWTYPDPKPAAEAVRDRVAFWKGVAVQS